MITNEGRKILGDDEKAASPTKSLGDRPQTAQTSTSSKHKKKVLSKPIESLAATFD